MESQFRGSPGRNYFAGTEYSGHKFNFSVQHSGLVLLGVFELPRWETLLAHLRMNK